MGTKGDSPYDDGELSPVIVSGEEELTTYFLGLITAEETARIAADAVIQTALDTEVSTREQLRTEFDALEVEFDALEVEFDALEGEFDTHAANTSNPHTVAHSQLSDKGSNTHSQIDSHIANGDIHVAVGITSKSAGYTITDSDGVTIIAFSGLSSDATCTLPTLADNSDRMVTVINLDSTYCVTVDGEGSEEISGMTSIELPRKKNRITIIGGSSEWILLDDALTCYFKVDEHDGFGSTDTKIERFSNTTISLVGNLISENHSSGYNSNAEGLEITINKAGKYSFSYCFGDETSVNSTAGLSLNSTELTTAVGGISIEDLYGLENKAAATAPGTHTVVAILDLKIGDVVRPHTNGSTPDYVAGSFFYVNYIGP